MATNTAVNVNAPTTKVKTVRRTWNGHEDEALADCLKEIVAEGWKSDNSFRNGYLQVLENKLKVRCPGSGLTANKHILSKITVWKRIYATLSTMARTSGLGWSSEANMVTVESEDVWNQHIKAHPDAAPTRYKIYPFYPTWCEVFGKDRATGEQAMGYDDAKNVEQGDYLVDLTHLGLEEDVASKVPETRTPQSVPKPPQACDKQSLSGNKRNKPESSIIQIQQTADKFLEKSEEFFNTITKKLFVDEMSFGDKTKLIMQAVEEVPNISDQAVIFVQQKLIGNPANMEMFLNWVPERRNLYVKMIIEGKIL